MGAGSIRPGPHGRVRTRSRRSGLHGGLGGLRRLGRGFGSAGRRRRRLLGGLAALGRGALGCGAGGRGRDGRVRGAVGRRLGAVRGRGLLGRARVRRAGFDGRRGRVGRRRRVGGGRDGVLGGAPAPRVRTWPVAASPRGGGAASVGVVGVGSAGVGVAGVVGVLTVGSPGVVLGCGTVAGGSAGAGSASEGGAIGPTTGSAMGAAATSSGTGTSRRTGSGSVLRRTFSTRRGTFVVGGENRDSAGPVAYQSSKPGATTPISGISSGPGTNWKSAVKSVGLLSAAVDARAFCGGTTVVCRIARRAAKVSALAPAPTTGTAGIERWSALCLPMETLAPRNDRDLIVEPAAATAP